MSKNLQVVITIGASHSTIKPRKTKEPQKLEGEKREKPWVISRPAGDFFSIRACFNNVKEFYLLCMRALDKECVEKGTNLEDFISAKMKEAKVKPAIYKDPRHNVYYILFRKAENVVRKKYCIRPTHNEFFYDHVNTKMEELLGKPFLKIMNSLSHTIPVDDPSLQKKLDAKYPARFAQALNDITEDINESNWQDKLREVNELPLYEKGEQTGDVFYRAAKVFADFDRATAISFYLRYLHVDSGEKIKRPLQKPTYAKLFKKDSEVRKFEESAKALESTNNLDAALTEAPFIFTKKHTTIELDATAIDKAAANHSQAVRALNNVLGDHSEPEPAKSAKASKPTSQSLDAVQLGLLDLFRKNNYSLKTKLLDKYAKSKGVFKSKLVDGINDCCYKILDDVLIEETGEGYEILEKYYNKIIGS